MHGRCGASLGQYSTLTKFLLDVLSIVTGNLDRRGGMVFGDPMVDLDGNTVSSFILQPTPLTADNLQLAVDGGQISQADLCKGVDPATGPSVCAGAAGSGAPESPAASGSTAP